MTNKYTVKKEKYVGSGTYIEETINEANLQYALNHGYVVIAVNGEPVDHDLTIEYYVRVEKHQAINLVYAATLDALSLDVYGDQFGVDLDRRGSVHSMLTALEASLTPTVEETPIEEVKTITDEQKPSNADAETKAEATKPKPKSSGNKIPKDRQCPHCKIKARSDKAYKNNHGDKCLKSPSK